MRWEKGKYWKKGRKAEYKDKFIILKFYVSF